MLGSAGHYVSSGRGTFYSSGSFLKSTIPFNKHAKFSARNAYDGRFVTFKLDPGDHTLTANSWMIASPIAGEYLEVNLVLGQHLYVGAYLESLTADSRFRLELRTCQEAQQDNETTRRLDPEHIKECGLLRAVNEVSFPLCHPVTP
jgi:hypothetical protein